MGERVVIASRGSKLALAQAGALADASAHMRPGIEVEIRTVTTKGDRDDRPFYVIGGKGLFTSEVEREVVEGRADVAVHSAKDLTAAVHPEATIVCVPPRAAAHDVLVGGGAGTAEERLPRLPPGTTVGTSSLRRRAQLLEVRDDLEVADLRGNLDTRLRKVREQIVHAAVLAAAGIQRLGLEEQVEAAPLDPSWWVPAPGQGALAVEARRDRGDLAELFAPLDDPASRAALACERAFAARLEGGCSVPLGCHAVPRDGTLFVIGYVGRPDGTYALRDRISGPFAAAAGLGRELAEAMLAGGADEILEDIRAAG